MSEFTVVTKRPTIERRGPNKGPMLEALLDGKTLLVVDVKTAASARMSLRRQGKRSHVVKSEGGYYVWMDDGQAAYE